MEFDRQLRRQIAMLNNEGGFGNKIMYKKVAEMANGSEKVFEILKSLEAKGDEVKDPTAYITVALRKSGAAMGPPPMFHDGYAHSPPPMVHYGYAPDAYAYAPDISQDRELSKRIRILNTSGGFENQINYNKVMEAARGLTSTQVGQVLERLEQKKDEVKDPTSFVTAGCRRLGGGQAAASYGAGAWVPMPMTMPMQISQHMPHYAPHQPMFDREADRKLRKQIAWMNNEGGFENQINYQKVLDVAQYVDIHTTMKMLKKLEEKKDEVKDPTAFVTSRIRKVGSETGPYSGPQDGGNVDPDRQVRRRIAWLNNEGGFGNSIIYTKVNEAVSEGGDVGLDDIMQVLDSLQEQKDTVRDPTNFVTAGISRRANSKKSGGHGVLKTINKVKARA